MTSPLVYTTERDVLDALRHKYTKIPPGWNADRFVRAEHVRKNHGYTYASRIADLLVIDTYGETALLGFEVKVSRSDWLTELRDPTKAEAWKQHCNRWYLAVPELSIVRDDLPEGWGLIAPNRSGKWVVRKQAPYISDPQPLSPMDHAQIARSIAKTAAREALEEA
jgi:hypothetical protein